MPERDLLFSVVIPTHNRAALVKQAVASVRRQTIDSFEVIVVDDGSTDATQETLAQFAGNIRLFTQENQGAEQARNCGINVAQGNYIVFLDSDDLLLPHALSVYRKVIEQTNAALIIARGVGFSEGAGMMVPSDNDILQFVQYKDILSKKQSMWLSTSFIVVNRKLLVDRQIGFRKGTFPVDDLDFLLRAGTVGPCVFVNQPATVLYRLHATNSVHDIKQNIARCEMIIDMERHGEYPGGSARAFDRFALIGGHVQCWGRKGIQAGFYAKSIKFFYKGFWMLCAVAAKKLLDLISRILHHRFQ